MSILGLCSTLGVRALTPLPMESNRPATPPGQRARNLPAQQFSASRRGILGGCVAALAALPASTPAAGLLPFPSKAPAPAYRFEGDYVSE